MTTRPEVQKGEKNEKKHLFVSLSLYIDFETWQPAPTWINAMGRLLLF